MRAASSYRFIALITALALFNAPASALSGPAQLPRLDRQWLNAAAPDGAARQALYLVRLADPPLALYRGQVPGLAATSPAATGAGRLQPDSPASLAYRSFLSGRRAEVLARMAAALGRTVEARYAYETAFNGMAVALTPVEASRAAGLEGVLSVKRESVRQLLTDVGPEWIGAPGLWDGTSTGGLPGTQGEGVIVGIIDTGINADHPSFADIGGDGYNHTNPFGSGNYAGWCETGFPILVTCNDKLIGAWSYADSGNNPEDDDGHGSHTASTVAGNVLTATLAAPTTSITDTIWGVAPHANIIAYDACHADGCPESALVAAVDQAVLDGVDVINYSISGGTDSYNDSVSLAFLAAMEAGIFVSASAGNSGPSARTVNHADPWVLTVAASTHNRKLINALINMSGGGTPPGDMTGASFTSGYGPAPIVYAGDFGDPLCPLGAFAPGTFSGEIVVCDRGTHARVDKAQSVLDGGAGGFVLANDLANGDSLAGDSYALPGVHITYADGAALKAWLASGAGHTATVAGTTISYDLANGDVMASFSSRGPNRILADLLKPDVTAPGVDVWAAYKDPELYNFVSGTSMSSPHAAGAGALLRALHPGWSPMQVKSALMLTALDSGLLKEDGLTGTDLFDAGAGRVDLSAAGRTGFVLNETEANFTSANPALGGDLTSLNLPSLADSACFVTCTWTRTLSSTQAASVNWTVDVSAPAGLELTVTPDSFSLPAFGTQVITIQADVSALPQDAWYFASISLSPGAPGLPDAHLPVAVNAASSTDLDALTKTTAQASVQPGGIITYTIELANYNAVTTTFSVTDPIPADTTYLSGSATGGLIYNAGQDHLTASASLGPLDVQIVTDTSPVGYLSPASLGGVFLCEFFTSATGCNDVAIILSGVDFDFMGSHYTQTVISSNGFMVAGGTLLGSTTANQNMPNTGNPDNVIAPFWTDLDLDHPVAADAGAGDFYFAVHADGSATYTVIGWEGAQLRTNAALTYTFQVWIEDGTDSIWFVYEDLDSALPASLSVGAENADGTQGDTYRFNATGTAPQAGVDLRVLPLPASQTFTFAVTAGSGVSAGTLISNVVDVSDGSLPLIQAWTGSTVGGQYGVAVTPPAAALSADPGSVVTYTLSVTNTGNLADTYTLGVSGNAWSTGAPSSVGPLAPGASTTVNVGVTVPPGALGGASDAATVTLTSQGDAGQADSSGLTTTANTIRGVAVAPPSGAQSGLPGAVVTYTLTVTNTGNLTDTFEVSVSGNIWDATAPASLGPVAPFESASLQVSVTISPTAPSGATDAVTVTLASQADGTKTAAASLTTTATSYGVIVTPAAAGQTASPGAVVTYTLRVTNTGSLADSYSISVAGNAWATGAPASLGPLAPGEGADVPVTVTIAAGVLSGTTDAATITFTSQGDGNVTGSSVLTTESLSYTVLLPAIFR